MLLQGFTSLIKQSLSGYVLVQFILILLITIIKMRFELNLQLLMVLIFALFDNGLADDCPKPITMADFNVTKVSREK